MGVLNACMNCHVNDDVCDDVHDSVCGGVGDGIWGGVTIDYDYVWNGVSDAEGCKKVKLLILSSLGGFW